MGNRKNNNTITYYDRYGGRNEARLSNDLLTSILDYTEAINDDVIDAAQEIQEKMLAKVTEKTPVRNYPYRGGVIGHITVSRTKTAPAQRVNRPPKAQPGVTKRSWKRMVNYGKLGDSSNYAMKRSRIGANIVTDTKPETIFAVRNLKRAPLIHLLNFDHELLVGKKNHRKNAGTVKGTKFVSEVQEWGRNELDKKIKEILNSK